MFENKIRPGVHYAEVYFTVYPGSRTYRGKMFEKRFTVLHFNSIFVLRSFG